MNKEKEQEILKKRAIELSISLDEEKNNFETIEIVEFRLSDERYAIESTSVREVYSLKEFTQLPSIPKYILGIMNIRGEIVTVVDLKVLFEIPKKELQNLQKVIVIEQNNLVLGILVDNIIGVYLQNINDIKLGIPTLTDIRSEFLLGVTKDQLVIIDAIKFINEIKLC
ncbi:chemotaxis protein CheW [Pigmentibacter sp. JX0631]|uniref:chemotaxis protein CheW n=1 Tax=Pigmentibacter sp. JX0631 TaxID=2976982 RepID=UPI002469494F|nr:chemotaxis protein CheW [Pigmentibacter sp. JX0631]WGL61099.1 chemotaxis protein CheW [Pigmentibacter sp. JX0631]